MKFGPFLKQLRESRGITQAQLVTRARASDYTLSKGENADKCPWKKSTAIDIFNALEAIAEEQGVPITTNEAENYYQLAGLEAFARQGRESMKTTRARHVAAVKDANDSTVAMSTKDDPQHTTAHTWLQRLLEAGEEERILDSLRVMAVMLNVELPPAGDRRRAWVYHDLVQLGDGVEASIRAPIPISSKRVAPQKAQPKRKPGA